jgi:DMSO reductase family type II enzyme iron-sulfur subunit
MSRIKVDHQLAVVIDLNKCLGCQTCSMACKRLWTRDEGMEHMWWNKVNTMPGLGSPKGWEKMGGGFKGGVPQRGKLPSLQEFGEPLDLNYEEVYRSGQGKRAYLHPRNQPKWAFNWDEDEGAGVWPNSFFFYLPRLCNHCTNPACLAACPRSAIYKRQEDGIVLIDEARCKGYRYCMEACPYKVIYFNHLRKVSQKCISCFPRVEKGTPPACARQCPGRLRFVGYVDDQSGPIHRLVTKWKVALRLHPEFETEPNIYYIPPFSAPKLGRDFALTDEPRIPIDYLRGLFGAKVDDSLRILREERAKKAKGEPSELMDTLIGFRWPRDFFKLPGGRTEP